MTILDAGERCCDNLPASASTYINKWLKTKGVTYKRERIARDDKSEGSFRIDEAGGVVHVEGGLAYKADVIYTCMGMRPASGCLSKGEYGLSDAISERGYLQVTDTLQVMGHANIFGMGDVMFHKASNEMKLGHTAEVNAHLVVENLRRLRDSSRGPLLLYPQGA